MVFPHTSSALTVAIVACMASASASASAQDYSNGRIDPNKKSIYRLRDIANRVCINIGGEARQGIVNTATVQHYLHAKNICPNIIHIKACYMKTERCVDFDMHSREEKTVLLGVTTADPSAPFFTFDFTEKALF